MPYIGTGELFERKHGFLHANANAVVQFTKQGHAGAAENSDDLITEQYNAKENLKFWLDKIMAEVKILGAEVEEASKKAGYLLFK